jgi:hypothetical protein
MCLTPAIKSYDSVENAYTLVRTEVIVPPALHIDLACSERPFAEYDYDWVSTAKFNGTPDKGGHYTCSVTRADSPYNVNDDRVTKVDLDTALRCDEDQQVAMLFYKQRGGDDQRGDDGAGDQRGLMQLGAYGEPTAPQALAIVPEPHASASTAAFPADVLYFLMGLLAHSSEDASTLRSPVSVVSKAWRRAASEAGKHARRALPPARTRGSQAEDATPPCSPVDNAAMALLSGGGAAAGVLRPPSQADPAGRLALLAHIAKKIDGEQLDAARLTMDDVGALMLSLDGSSSSDRLAAIAGLRTAFEAPALDGSPHARLYADVKRKHGAAASAYAPALVPGLPVAIRAFGDALAAAGSDDASRARAFAAAMQNIVEAALPAPTHAGYRLAVGVAPYADRRGNAPTGMQPLTDTPTPAFIYLQQYTLHAAVVRTLAASLRSAPNLVWGGPNGAALGRYNHVSTVDHHARLVGGDTVTAYRVGKSDTENPHEAGKRVNKHSIVHDGAGWVLDGGADATLAKMWAGTAGAFAGYRQVYLAVGPKGKHSSLPGELLVGDLIGAGQCSGLPFLNVTPCGPGQVYADRGDPGQMQAAVDLVGKLGGLQSAFDARADAAALALVEHAMLQLQLATLLRLVATSDAVACEAAARAVACEAAARAAAATAGVSLRPGPGTATPPTLGLSVGGALFGVLGERLFDFVPRGVFQVHRLPARVRRRWAVARCARLTCSVLGRHRARVVQSSLRRRRSARQPPRPM